MLDGTVLLRFVCADKSRRELLDCAMYNSLDEQHMNASHHSYLYNACPACCTAQCAANLSRERFVPFVCTLKVFPTVNWALNKAHLAIVLIRWRSKPIFIFLVLQHFVICASNQPIFQWIASSPYVFIKKFTTHPNFLNKIIAPT